MEFITVDSEVKVPERLRVVAASRAEGLAARLFELPVYLVSPGTMDRLYPPERRVFLDPACLREAFAALDRQVARAREGEDAREIFLGEKGIPEEIWAGQVKEALARCRRERADFAAMGLYVSSPSEAQKEALREAGGPFPEGPAIFICPERVKDLAAEGARKLYGLGHRSAFNFLFVEVWLHEAAHAYMDAGHSLREPWERLLEESLATALTYCALQPEMDEEEKALFLYAVSRQPLEYQGWRYFAEERIFSFSALSPVARAWSRREPIAVLPLWWLYPLAWPLGSWLAGLKRRKKIHPLEFEEFWELLHEWVHRLRFHWRRLSRWLPGGIIPFGLVADERFFWFRVAMVLLRALA